MSSGSSQASASGSIVQTHEYGVYEYLDSYCFPSFIRVVLRPSSALLKCEGYVIRSRGEVGAWV